MEARAKLSNCPGSPRKMRLVADIVRGMNVDQSLNTLRFTGKAGARIVEKLLLSAVYNWRNGNPGAGVDDSQLVVKSITVDQGKTLKRFRPASFGRPARIRKRMNHITIVVDSKESLAQNAGAAE